jgi:WD40 repeat protein
MGSTSKDKTVRVWDVEHSKPTFCFDDLKNPAHYLRWSPNGKLLCVNEDHGAMHIFDPRDDKSSAQTVKMTHEGLGK